MSRNNGKLCAYAKSTLGIIDGKKYRFHTIQGTVFISPINSKKTINSEMSYNATKGNWCNELHQ